MIALSPATGYRGIDASDLLFELGRREELDISGTEGTLSMAEDFTFSSKYCFFSTIQGSRYGENGNPK